MTKPFAAKIKKIAAWGVSVTLTILAVLITVTIGWRPVLGARSRPLTGRHFERTPERLERGRYLVNGVVLCFDCHSQAIKDFQDVKPGESPILTKYGSGRVLFQEDKARIVAPNITPDMETGAGSWTDDQFARAIREGIGHDGRTLFPLMPYDDFRYLSDEDLASVIVYIRSLEPVRHPLPKTQVPFPLSRLIKSAPKPITEPVVVNFPRPHCSRALSHGSSALRQLPHTQEERPAHPRHGLRRW
jgi:hypothetical protein